MEDILNYLETAFRQVNYIQGLIIALVAALVMTRFKQIFIYGLLATIIHVGIDIARANWQFPNIVEQAFYSQLALLFVGYLIFIGVLFGIKSLFLRSGH